MVKKRTIWSILEPLLYEKEFIHLRELARRANIPHTTLINYLNTLEEKGIVIKKKTTLTQYRINREHPLIIDYITITEKEKLIRKCEKSLLLREIIYYLHQFDKPLLIFGSAVENIKNANDVDILTLKSTNLNQIENKLNIKFHLLSIKNIKEISSTLKQEIIKKHILVNFTEGWVKWMLED